MLTVTQAAAEQLKELKQNAEDGPKPLRVFRSGEGLALGHDEPGEQDHKVEREGQTLLVFDDDVSEILAERTLDVRETEQGAVLVVR